MHQAPSLIYIIPLISHFIARTMRQCRDVSLEEEELPAPPSRRHPSQIARFQMLGNKSWNARNSMRSLTLSICRTVGWDFQANSKIVATVAERTPSFSNLQFTLHARHAPLRLTAQN